MSLTEDIKEAQIKARIKSDTPTLFTSTSHIYRATNENMKDKHYIECLQDKEKILSVIGSGDQILNSILLGSKEIDAFDISRFPKYFLDLKIAAIKLFDYEEYLSFFSGNNAFNRKMFKRVIETIKGDSKEFWESVAYAKKVNPKKLYRSSLFTGNLNIDYNPYLEESNFYQLKRKIKDAHISYTTGNILNIGKELTKDYDCINLSNICMYQSEMYVDYPGKTYEGKFRSFIRNLRINPNGVVLNYLMGYKPGSICYKYVENYYKKEPDFRIFEIDNEEKIEKDGLLVYQKK